MLSRVAERTYWMARYLERAENTARLVNVYSALLLDLPESAGLGWEVVLEIDGCREEFSGDENSGEAAMLTFLLHDEANPGALLNSLNMARENARTTRDIVPNEAFRAVNELCLYAREQLPRAVRPRQRAQIMSSVVERIHALTGLLAGTMSHAQPYQFIRLGRNLERAEMTTRMIDVAAAILLAGRSELVRYDNTLWMTVLRCLSAYQMYRQYLRRRVRGPDVIHFLLQDRDFPRSVTHCVDELSGALRMLPRAEGPGRLIAGMSEQIATMDTAALDNEAIHQLVDKLQIEIAAIHNGIAETWFFPADAA